MDEAGKIRTVLFVGSKNRGGNDVSLFKAFQHLLGKTNVHLVEQKAALRLGSLRSRLATHILGGPDFFLQRSLSQKVLLEIERVRPDIVFGFKAIYLSNSTLLQIKRSRYRPILAHFHPDNLLNHKTSSRVFEKAKFSYDVHFVPKLNSLNWYTQNGLRSEYLPYAADPEWHFPAKDGFYGGPGLGAPVTFVGHYERERADLIAFLSASGISGIRVWGESWKPWGMNHPQIRVEPRGLYEAEMSAAFYHSTVSLGFLRKANFDEITARTFEIPSAEGCMLHERTDEAVGFFEEDKEAVYFGSPEELVAKTRWLLANPARAKEIAVAGRRRVLSHRYNYDERAAQVIARCEQIAL